MTLEQATQWLRDRAHLLNLSEWAREIGTDTGTLHGALNGVINKGVPKKIPKRCLPKILELIRAMQSDTPTDGF